MPYTSIGIGIIKKKMYEYWKKMSRKGNPSTLLVGV
jgi:hypothetical protein